MATGSSPVVTADPERAVAAVAVGIEGHSYVALAFLVREAEVAVELARMPQYRQALAANRLAVIPVGDGLQTVRGEELIEHLPLVLGDVVPHRVDPLLGADHDGLTADDLIGGHVADFGGRSSGAATEVSLHVFRER